MIPMGCGAAIAVASRVAGVEQSRAGSFEHGGLRIVGQPAGNAHAVVLEILEGSLGIISEAIG